LPELEIRHAGITLAATYTPSGSVALVALHGAGEGERDFYLYQHLHQILPPRGIGVVTFDRRGEGQSTGEPSRGHFETQAADALAVLEAVDAERVGLWGISQGAWVAPLAAARSDRVAFLVLLASTGVTPAEQMRYAVATQIAKAGYGEEAVLQATHLRDLAEEWLSGGRPDGLEDKLKEASRLAWWSLAFLPSELPGEAERLAINEEMFFAPEPVFAQTRAPTLLFYGEDDEWSPVQPSIEAWRRSRDDGIEIVILPGTGHEPILADGTISPLYERVLVDWLQLQKPPAI
jgi:pimeloyl-ACP methyl ester carboxylesterase